MSYLTEVIDGNYHIQLVDEPSYCHALPYAPTEIEPELTIGIWLVLNYAGWSGPDRTAIQQVLDLGHRFGGSLTIGIRPFDDHGEIQLWCPSLTERGASPVWVFLCNGECFRVLTCMRSDDEVLEVVRELQGKASS